MDKVYHLRKIKDLPGQERRNAELALFCRQPLQAEAIYIQAGMIFRAIEMNMTLFNWERCVVYTWGISLFAMSTNLVCYSMPQGIGTCHKTQNTCRHSVGISTQTS